MIANRQLRRRSPRQRDRYVRRRVIAAGCSMFLVVGCLIVSVIAVKIRRLQQVARSTETVAVQVENMLLDPEPRIANPQQTAQLLNDVREQTVVIRNEVRPFLFLAPFLSWLPEVGPLMPDAKAYIELSDALTEIGEIAAPQIETALTILQAENLSDEESIPKLLELIADSSIEFERIEPLVERAQNAYASIENRDALPTKVKQYLPLIDAYLLQADELLELVETVPDLLGTYERRNYVVIAQDEDTLRPTGGLIRDIGLISFKDGDVVLLEFASVIQKKTLGSLDSYGPAQAPYAFFMNQPELTFYDSNYWADFPDSAETIRDLFTQSYGDDFQIDGVIAIDQRFIQLFIEATGALSVPDIGQINHYNIREYMRNAQNVTNRKNPTASADWWLNHSGLMTVIFEAAQARIATNFRTLDLQKFGLLMTQAIDEHHLQIVMFDAHESDLMHELDWDGRLEPHTNEDTLLVVDTNVGYNAANQIVERTLSYAIELLPNGGATAQVDITYQHNPIYAVNEDDESTCTQLDGYPTSNAIQPEFYVDQCYYNYLRIYAPSGTRLVNATTHETAAEWLLIDQPWQGEASAFADNTGLTRLENFFVLQRAQTLKSSYSYDISGPLVQTVGPNTRQYKLNILKQAGQKPEAMDVTVALPVGASFISASPKPLSMDGDLLHFQFTLTSDKLIEIQFR